MSADASGDSSLIEGRLSQRLHSALNTTCDKFVSGIKFSQMKEIFKVIYERDPEKLKSYHNQLRSQLLQNIKAELDETCKKFEIDTLLNSLEKIEKQQESSDLSWRPSKIPKEDLRDHIHAIKLQQKKDLTEMLEKLRMKNEELNNTVALNHAEINLLKKSYDENHEKLSIITDALTGDDLKDTQITVQNVCLGVLT